MLTVKFNPDSVKVNGPLVDGSINVTFSAGQHQALAVAPLIAVPKQAAIEVEIKISSPEENQEL